MRKKVKVFLGADHAGFAMKERIKQHLQFKKLLVSDLSPHFVDGDDYPQHAFRVAEQVVKGKDALGILFCRTGTGMIIAANKVRGVRAVEAYDAYSAKMSRLDNNANVLGLGTKKVSFTEIKKIVDAWVNTSFSKAKRHQRRVQLIERYEQRS